MNIDTIPAILHVGRVPRVPLRSLARYVLGGNQNRVQKMTEILNKISEITREQIPIDPAEQKKFALDLINGVKIDLAQYSNKLDRKGLEEHLFQAEVFCKVLPYLFDFLKLHLTKKHNAKFEGIWETNEQTKKAKKVGYESGDEQKAKAKKSKKSKASGTDFEKRGKSVEDRVIVDMAKALLSTFKHLPEAEAKAAAFQMAKSQFEKISGGRK